jgi:hypothetical protein
LNLSITTRDENDLLEDEEKIPNPLHWFGVLVPPPLREAQGHFTSAVDQCLARLANSAQQIQQLEIQVGRQRKKIGKLEKSAKSIVSLTKTAA